MGLASVEEETLSVLGIRHVQAWAKAYWPFLSEVLKHPACKLNLLSERRLAAVALQLEQAVGVPKESHSGYWDFKRFLEFLDFRRDQSPDD